MAKKPTKKAAPKAAAKKAEAAPPSFEVGQAVKYQINDEEAAELEKNEGDTLPATIEQIKETGECILKIQYRTHQTRVKGCYPGNKPGNFTV